jgi:molybdopterin synthase catalytic subunit
VALIPPVSGGGEEDVAFRITEEPLSIEALHALVLRPGAGAVSHFVGVVRDSNLGRAVDHLEYDAYPAMATKKMREIAEEVRERWPINAIAMHHRVGRLAIGEASVAIAVSSPHRADGIAACHYAIDRLKQVVPIWKKEVWTDGEHWIEGSLTPQAEAKPGPEAP